MSERLTHLKPTFGWSMIAMWCELCWPATKKNVDSQLVQRILNGATLIDWRRSESVLSASASQALLSDESLLWQTALNTSSDLFERSLGGNWQWDSLKNNTKGWVVVKFTFFFSTRFPLTVFEFAKQIAGLCLDLWCFNRVILFVLPSGLHSTHTHTHAHLSFYFRSITTVASHWETIISDLFFFFFSTIPFCFTILFCFLQKRLKLSSITARCRSCGTHQAHAGRAPLRF